MARAMIYVNILIYRPCGGKRHFRSSETGIPADGQCGPSQTRLVCFRQTDRRYGLRLVPAIGGRAKCLVQMYVAVQGKLSFNVLRSASIRESICE